jgi:hypothetical protein
MRKHAGRRQHCGAGWNFARRLVTGAMRSKRVTNPLQVANLPYTFRCAFRKRPVCDVLHAAMSSGVPLTTTSPPA